MKKVDELKQKIKSLEKEVFALQEKEINLASLKNELHDIELKGLIKEKYKDKVIQSEIYNGATSTYIYYKVHSCPELDKEGYIYAERLEVVIDIHDKIRRYCYNKAEPISLDNFERILDDEWIRMTDDHFEEEKRKCIEYMTQS